MSTDAADLSSLAKTVAEMRALGVSEYRSGAVHIVLGEAPVAPVEPPKLMTNAELKAEYQKVKEYREKMLFASSEGFDEDIDLTPEEPDGIAGPPTDVTST